MSDKEQIGGVVLDLSKYPGEDFYCDGSVEDEILKIVKENAPEDYAAEILKRKDWPTLYHLSGFRGNIAGWIPFDGTEKVLEIGAGPGAVTGTIASKVSRVDCVDLSKKRSLINAYRNRGRDNVTIHVGNFADIEPTLPDDYDYIFLIGVFEYFSHYIDAEDPFRAELKKILPHAKKSTGRIVIAIENRLGLKYFAGAREDHTGKFFDGIENYESAGADVHTFSKPALEKIFKDCGASEYSFYYPYPDYKFPTAIYSDRRLPRGAELSDNIRNFDRSRLLLFNEKLAYDGLAEDGLYPLFSNSFEAVIGPSLSVTYARFSNDRAQKYRILTEFREENGQVRVVKKALVPEAKEHVEHLVTAFEELKARFSGTPLSVCPCRKEADGEVSFDRAEGIPLEELLDRKLFTGDLAGFNGLIRAYAEAAGANDSYPASDPDMTFANILVDRDGAMCAIDYEWEEARPMAAKDLLVRALTVYFAENPKRESKIPEAFLKDHFGITDEDLEAGRAAEKAFQAKVTGGSIPLSSFRAMLGMDVIVPKEIQAQNPGIEKETLSKEEFRAKKEEKKRKADSISSVQIYFDRGNGYSEQDSYFAPEMYGDEGRMSLTVRVPGDVRNLRVDPALCPCFVLPEKMTVDGRTVHAVRKAMRCSGTENPDGSITFTTNDPWMEWRMDKLLRQAGIRGGRAGESGAEERTVTLSYQMCGMPSTMAARMSLDGAKRRNLL